MNENDNQSITEKLDVHNQAILIASAKEKLASGKRLSVHEKKACEDAETNKRRADELPFMRRMPKKEYIERFGGSRKVYNEWEARWQFPWQGGEKHVNTLEILCWYRDHVSAGTESASLDPDDHATRLKKAQADRQEILLAKDRGELLPVDEVVKDFRHFGMRIQEAVESLETISPDAYRIMLDALRDLEISFALDGTETEAHDSNGKAKGSA